MYESLRESFQGVKRLFVLAYVIAVDAANSEAGQGDDCTTGCLLDY